MARKHGKLGRVYFAVASGGTAAPFTGAAQWTIGFATDKQDVTAQGDNNKQYVNGFPDIGGSINGFYDDSTAGLYVAAADGLKRKAYFYPDATDNTRYWHGEIVVDVSFDSAVSNGTPFAGEWKAAGNIYASAALSA